MTIPEYFQPAAESCICDLLDKGIIKKLDYHMAGVSLPFFVSQSQEDIRLVMDFISQ